VPFDDASTVKLNALYPDIKVRAIHFELDVKKVLSRQIRVTEGLRSFKRQTDLYLKGRELINGVFQVVNKSQVVTNAMPGESVHHYGLAFDICFQGDDPYLSTLHPKDFDYSWRKTGEIAQKNGFKWGYDWNGNGLVDGNDFDRPHFQLTYGEQVHNLRELYSKQKLASVWARIDQVRQVPIGQDWDTYAFKSKVSSLE